MTALPGSSAVIVAIFAGSGVLAEAVVASQGGAPRTSSYYTERLDDPKAVFLDHDTFGARGDGVADDTSALQKAIDRAAMVAGKKTAQEYVGEWRRTAHPLQGELVPTVESLAAQIDREFPNERLHALVDNGGWDPARPQEDSP